MPSLPSHLFLASEGALYDTRRADWAKHPLRADYSRTHKAIATCAQLKATLRAGRYAWPGGYPLFFLTYDGGTLSFAAVRENLREVLDAIQTRGAPDWRVVACDVNWEEGELTCDHTGERIESAYAD